MQYPTEIKLLFDFQETEIQYRLKYQHWPCHNIIDKRRTTIISG